MDLVTGVPEKLLVSLQDKNLDKRKQAAREL